MCDNITKFEMAVAGTSKTQDLLTKLHAKYGTSKALPPETNFVVGHTLFYGSAGTGKTTSAVRAIKLAGATEENKTFIRLSADTIKTTIDLIRILESILPWDGYLCNNGKIDHKYCKKCKIVDSINPRGVIKNVFIFIDEVHNLNKEVQEGLLLILEDFRYNYRHDSYNYNVFFPRFTLVACTTNPGDLLKPMLSRFKIKLKVDIKTDQEMESVVTTLASERGIILEDGALKAIARISQGIARESRNHVEGLYNCWAYLLQDRKNSQISGLREDIITEPVALFYAKINGFFSDGTCKTQVEVLEYLNTKNDAGRYITSGVKKLCNALGLDENYYLAFIEPRLVNKGWLDTGHSRRLTNKGIEYLNSITNNLD